MSTRSAIFWVMRIRGMSNYTCGYGLAASIFSGNWWWMLTWLSLPIGAVAELVVEAKAER